MNIFLRLSVTLAEAAKMGVFVTTFVLLVFVSSSFIFDPVVGQGAPWVPHFPGNVSLPAFQRGAVHRHAAEMVTSFTSTFRSLLVAEETTHGSSSSSVRSPFQNSQCFSDFESLFDIKTVGNLTQGDVALDAMGKPGPYILQGNLRVTGSFDECLGIGSGLTQYCLLPIIPVILEGDKEIVMNTTVFRVEVCLPRSCNITDIDEIVFLINNFLLSNKSRLPVKFIFYYVNESMICEDTKDAPYTGGAIAMITVCALFLLLSLIGTSVDYGVQCLRELAKKPEFASLLNRRRRGVYKYRKKKKEEEEEEESPLLGGRRPDADIFARFEKPLEFITAFSIIKNLNTILQTKQPASAITSLHGIRVLSMFWVILAHTYYWVIITGDFLNPLIAVNNVTHRFSIQPIVNGFFSVDSFFFLSGTLVSYLTLREMERKKGRFPILSYYIHRYLRLTMVYAFLLFFYWTLTVHLGDGLLWRHVTGSGSALQKTCEKYWWTNLLYINNFYPWALKDECMGWTWYLSNDMQFYVLAPLIVVPLYFFFPVGLIISGIFLVATFLSNGIIAGVKDLDANYFQSHDATISDDIYIKPYTRAAPYIVGLVFGYLLFKKVQIKIHWFIDWMLYRAVLVVAGGCLFSTVYGLYGSWGNELSLAEDVSYYTLSRFVWAVGLALLVFALHNGYGRAINAFLSMSFWVPLSRLTYTAYLIHPIILTVIFTTLREPFTYSDYSMAVYSVANVALSFGAAMVVAVFVEFPLSNLEMSVFKMIGLRPRESTRNTAATGAGKETSLKVYVKPSIAATPINN